jgi:hypothetical protein
VDRLGVGFVGRSSTWDLLRELVFPNHVSLRYVGSDTECSGLDLVLVEGYMTDLVHCPRTYVIDDVSVDGLVEALIRGLGLGELNVGVDIGNSRCGVAILTNDVPIIHATLGFPRLVKLLRRLSRYSRINLMVGTSPGVSELVRDLMGFLGDVDIRVSVVDEEVANSRRGLLEDKYPYLSTDELDGLAHAYTGLSRSSVRVVGTV